MAGWSKSHELSRCVVHFTAIGCVLCTYCCICMVCVGEQCFDCCKSCNLVDSSICQFPPMVCMISSIACDIQFRGICVQAPVGLQPFFCWKVQNVAVNFHARLDLLSGCLQGISCSKINLQNSKF